MSQNHSNATVSQRFKDSQSLIHDYEPRQEICPYKLLWLQCAIQGICGAINGDFDEICWLYSDSDDIGTFIYCCQAIDTDHEMIRSVVRKEWGNMKTFNLRLSDIVFDAQHRAIRAKRERGARCVQIPNQLSRQGANRHGTQVRFTRSERGERQKQMIKIS